MFKLQKKQYGIQEIFSICPNIGGPTDFYNCQRTTYCFIL